ncbi:MAG: spore coat protein [Spirochaetes bacterium RBG_13_68_11]|nr:MAG: spore coat protein [Spirochaetes bacterium RBG_13_68_11]
MITIGNRTLGPGKPCLVVAELGTGHLGSMERARELVDAAAEAGADCAKFQLVYADEILHPLSGAVDLPKGRVELYQRFRELEQPVSFYREIKEYVESKGLAFLCSPFGLRSARELRALGVSALKIASPELNHLPLLDEVAGYGLPLILSSGVSTLADIERALEVTGRDRVVLLHCITAYPAPEDEYNVSLIASLRAVFGVEVGLSDHSIDPVLVPALAVLHGARVVEKHFALSRTGSGLDDPIALEPASFARMVRGIRKAEEVGSADVIHRLEKEYGADRVRRVIGTGVKDLAPSERENYRRTNRSIHAVAEIPAGSVIAENAVAVLRTEKRLRPGLGPEFLPVVTGRKAARTIPAGEGVTWEDLG